MALCDGHEFGVDAVGVVDRRGAGRLNKYDPGWTAAPVVGTSVCDLGVLDAVTIGALQHVEANLVGRWLVVGVLGEARWDTVGFVGRI